MSNIKYVPVQSYHKATIIALFNNEGEVNWDHLKLNRRVNNNIELSNELAKSGYDRMQKDFTAQQVALLFKYISHPILNGANRKLLGLKNYKHELLTNFENKPELINRNMEYITKLSDGVLSGLGLRKKNGGDLNLHYEFIDNINFYFTRTEDGFFKMHDRNTLKVIKSIESTDELVKTLLKLKNSK